MVNTQLKGVGIGLREPHFQHILAEKPNVNWFEALADNYFNFNGIAFENLLQVRAHYPMALHSVGLSIASHEPLDKEYLETYKRLIESIKPEIVSDHLSWSSHGIFHSHELLPVLMTKKNLNYIASRIDAIQQYLDYPLHIENPSTYLIYKDNEMPEYEFFNRLVELTQCKILLDVNNVYVNSVNHDFDAANYITQLSQDNVGQFHLSGHSQQEGFLVDDHGSKVTDSVWTLYRLASQRFANTPTLIEWDMHIPEFSVLQQEVEHATRISDSYAR